MRDLLILGFILFLLGAACARPFLMSMAYIYVDLVSPQRITYYLLGAVPFSMIMAILAVLFFLFDKGKGKGIGRLQVLTLIFIAYFTIMTFFSALPDFAWVKWDSAWKSLGFAAFLPLVLQSRRRLETAVAFIVCSIGVITITGGIKTLAGGGGYGSINLLVSNNSGLYESSTISTVAVSVIPLATYLYGNSELFPRGRLLWTAVAGYILCALLIPIGTEARTGLVCAAVLAGMLWLKSNKKLLIAVCALSMIPVAWPLLPDRFTGRMSTIKTYDEDVSAATRLAVWSWTWNYVQSHPLGCGFECYRLNTIEVKVKSKTGSSETEKTVGDKARAFHNSYFEVLGQFGFPGLALYLAIVITGILQLRGIRRRFKDSVETWIPNLALALERSIIIYSIGSMFAGIAFQTTLYLILAVAAGLAAVTGRMATDVRDRERADQSKNWRMVAPARA